MQTCNLPYIPNHLHSLNKEIVNDFSIGEELYYRCNLDSCSKPYQSISLYDVSHNRNFCDSVNYPKEDVLFNIDSRNPIERILNKEINTSVINSLSAKNTFEKTIESKNSPDLFVNIKLIHDPKPCMYPHCVFEISLNGIVVNGHNYNTTLNQKAYKNLRSDIRLELTSIIYSSIVDNDSDIEFITEL